MDSNNKFTLSFKQDKATQTLIYNTSDKKFSYSYLVKKGYFICGNHTTRLLRENYLDFKNPDKQFEFDTAMENKEFKHALEMAWEIENDVSVNKPEPNPLDHPVSFFLKGYIAAQNTFEDENKSCCIRVGFFKKHSVQFDVENIKEAQNLAAAH